MVIEPRFAVLLLLNKGTNVIEVSLIYGNSLMVRKAPESIAVRCVDIVDEGTIDAGRKPTPSSEATWRIFGPGRHKLRLDFSSWELLSIISGYDQPPAIIARE